MVSGGSGALSFGLCERYPEMNVTLFEVALVVEMVKERFLPAVEDTCPNIHFRAGEMMTSYQHPFSGS